MSTPDDAPITPNAPNDPLNPNAPDPPQPDPGPEPTQPDPPLQPEQPVTYVPYMWYSATVACHTTACPNYNLVQDVPLLYSNAGTVNVVCGRCGKKDTVLTATLLDPQPAEE